MAKLVYRSLLQWECFCCPNRFIYIKECPDYLSFYESEHKFPGRVFLGFGPIKTTIIEHWWTNEDSKYYYYFFLTKNHFYAFRLEKKCGNLSL